MSAFEVIACTIEFRSNDIILLRFINIVLGQSHRYRPFLTASTNAVARRVSSAKSPESNSFWLTRLLPTPTAVAPARGR
jgi:hypothetical protein